MKKLFITILLFITVCGTSVRPANAIFGMGDIVFDPGSLVQSLVDYVIQGYQWAEQKMISAATIATDVNIQLEKINNQYLIPARDVLTVIAMMKSGQMIQNLVLGQLGVDPLLVRNPEKWIKNKGDEVVRGVLEDPQIKQSIYDVSIMRAIINQQKSDNKDLRAKIININQSDIPSIEQRARCNDSALYNQAVRDLRASGIDLSNLGPNDNTIANRKREIRNAVCGDINDPQVRAALLALAASNSSTNWNSWLAITSGDNEFNRQQRTLQILAKQQQAVEDQEQRELELNGGIRSEKKCVKYVNNDKSLPCSQYLIVKSGDLVNTLFKDSVTNPTKLQLASFGKGAGQLISSVTTLAGTAYTTLNLLDSISKDLGIEDTGEGDADGPSLVTTSAPVNDLIGNSNAKADIVAAPLEQLRDHKKSLNDLLSMNAAYLDKIQTEKDNLDEINNCYAYIESRYSLDFPDVVDDARLVAGQEFYAARITNNRELYTKVTTENSTVGIGTSIIDSVISKINASQSSEEILNLQLNYEKDLKRRNVPDLYVARRREGEVVVFGQKLEQAVTGIENSNPLEGGDIFIHKKRCEELRQEMEQKAAALYSGGGGGGGGSADP